MAIEATYPLVDGGYVKATQVDRFSPVRLDQYDAAGTLQHTNTLNHQGPGGMGFSVTALNDGGYVAELIPLGLKFQGQHTLATISDDGEITNQTVINGNNLEIHPGLDGGFAITYGTIANDVQMDVTQHIQVHDASGAPAGHAQLTETVQSITAEAGGGYRVAYANGESLRLDADEAASFANAPTKTLFTFDPSVATWTEGDNGLWELRLQVMRTGDISQEASVQYDLVYGTADAQDFSSTQIPGGYANFGAGRALGNIYLWIRGDTAPEADETFRILLSRPTGSATELEIVQSGEDLTIRNDDTAAPAQGAFSISGTESFAERNEGYTAFNYTVTRSGDLSQAAAVDYYVWGDEADGADFSAGNPLAGTARFEAGQASSTFQIFVAGDTVAEADETFHVVLSNGRGAVVSAEYGTFSSTILNDDGGSGSPDAQPQAVSDTGSIEVGATYAATGDLLANDVAGDGALTVSALRLTHTADTDGSDGFTQIGRYGTLTVQADGAYSYVLNSSPPAGSMDVFGYEVRDADGDTATASVTINITAGSGGGNPGPGGPTYFAVSGPGSVAEGNSGSTPFTFTVTRGGDVSAGGAVDYFVWGGAADGADFAGPTAGTVRFEAGEQSRTITIDVAGDTTDEADEAFNLTLSNARGGALAESTSTATGVILNDEGQGGGGDPGGEEPGGTTFAISGPGAVAEGNSGSTAFEFTVTRSGDLSQAGAVDYFLWGDAVDGSDFAGSTGGTARFEAGQASATITIDVAGDTAEEGDEAFQVSISNARGGTITTDTGGAIIVDDEGQGGEDPGGEEPDAATISVSGGGSVTEGDTGQSEVVFTFTRSGPATGEAAVDFWVWGDADGSDLSGQLGGTVRFADGETSQTITVNVLGDTLAEADEAFHVSLANARGAALGTDTAHAVILQNDGWIVA